MIGFFIGLGALLLSLTLYFRVNPVEGSVVDERVVGSFFHYVLLVTTMPAWIAGALIAGAVWPLAARSVKLIPEKILKLCIAGLSIILGSLTLIKTLQAG